MKLRLVAVLLCLAGGTVLWLTTTRQAKPVPQSASATALSKQSSRNIAASALPAPEGNPEVPGEVFDATTNAVQQGAVAPMPKPVALAAVEEPPAGPESTGAGSSTIPPFTALENVRAVFRQYTSRFGGNPVGSNPEITSALNGQNPRQVVFLNPDDGMQVNARGELVDSWGSPYFFHQLSRSEMEIHSAGPDRRMWTADDLVLK